MSSAATCIDRVDDFFLKVYPIGSIEMMQAPFHSITLSAHTLQRRMLSQKLDANATLVSNQMATVVN